MPVKKKFLIFFVFFFLTAACAGAFTEELDTGDWLKITRQRKVYFVLGSVEAFQRKGVIFRHTMEEYIGWMDRGASKNIPRRNMARVFFDLVVAQER